jgi:hypothetical protein
MTLSEMQTELYDTLNYGSSPPAEVVRRLLNFMNQSQREIVGMRGLGRLRRTILTCASVANSPFLILPQAAVRIAGIQDRTTQKSLKEVMLMDIRFADPGLTRVTSSPDAYAILGFSEGVAVQPSAAATIYVKSSNAADTQVAYIEVITTGGYYRTVNVTLTGTTAVSFSPTDVIQIRKFYLASATTGYVTLHEGSGSGTELSRIPVARQSARYTRVHLYGTPSAAVTYYVDVELHIESLANAGDEPYLPEDWHWLLPCGARMKEYLKREKMGEYNIEASRWKKGISDLKAFVRSRTDDGRQNVSEFSMLGPYYPAGS